MEMAAFQDDLFNSDHAFYIHDIKNSRPRLAMVYPPNYAVIDPSIRNEPDYEVRWSYLFWHELFHAENLHLTNLGVLQNAMEYLSENLVIYGFIQLATKGGKDGEHWLNSGIDMAMKQDILTRISLVANEVSPTYFQVSEHTRDLMTNLIYDNIILNFFGPDIPKSDLNNFIKEEGDKFISKVASQSVNRYTLINRQHDEAYRWGEVIIRKFNDVSYVHSIPIHAMELDITKIDIIAWNHETLQNKIIADNKNLDPTYRMEKIVNGGISCLPQVIQDNAEIAKDCEEYIQNLLLSSKIPEDIKKPYESEMKRIREKSIEFEKMSLAESFGRQKIFFEDAGKGTVFFIAPDIIENDRTEYYQSVLSSSYAYELILRLFGKTRYDNHWMSTIRPVLEELTTKVSTPNLNHVFVEKVVKVNYKRLDLVKNLPADIMNRIYEIST
jgi:hypothetical protein